MGGSGTIEARRSEAAEAQRRLDDVERAAKAAEQRLRDARTQIVSLGEEVAR